MYPKSTIITMNTLRLAAHGNIHAMYRVSSVYNCRLFTSAVVNDAFQLFITACILYLDGECFLPHVATIGEQLFKAIEKNEGIIKKPLVY